MSVFDKQYRKYTGELKGRFSKIWSIANQSFRVQFSGKKIFILLILCNLPVISFTLMLIFLAIFTPQQITSILNLFIGEMDVAMYTIISFTFNPGMIFLPIVFICSLNSGIIANDKKHNSLALYMSRPINRLDYTFGKAIAVYIISSFVTVVPWFVFLIAYTLLMSSSGTQFIETLWIYLSTLASGVIVVFFIGSIILLFSSMSKQSVLGGILAILILYLPSLISGSLTGIITSLEWINYFSISKLILSAIYLIFNKPSFDLYGIEFFKPDINGGISITIMLMIGIITLLLTIRNLYKEEIN